MSDDTGRPIKRLTERTIASYDIDSAYEMIGTTAGTLVPKIFMKAQSLKASRTASNFEKIQGAASHYVRKVAIFHEQGRLKPANEEGIITLASLFQTGLLERNLSNHVSASLRPLSTDPNDPSISASERRFWARQKTVVQKDITKLTSLDLKTLAWMPYMAAGSQLAIVTLATLIQETNGMAFATRPEMVSPESVRKKENAALVRDFATFIANPDFYEKAVRLVIEERTRRAGPRLPPPKPRQ